MNTDHLDMVNFVLDDDNVFSISSYAGEPAQVAIISEDGFVSPRFWADAPGYEDGTAVTVYTVAHLAEALEQAIIWSSSK